MESTLDFARLLLWELLAWVRWILRWFWEKRLLLLLLRVFAAFAVLVCFETFLGDHEDGAVLDTRFDEAHGD